jgi:hypothetical protein
MILGAATANDVYTGALQPEFCDFWLKSSFIQSSYSVLTFTVPTTQSQPNAIMSEIQEIQPYFEPSTITLNLPKGDNFNPMMKDFIEKQLESDRKLDKVRFCSGVGVLIVFVPMLTDPYNRL